MQLVIYVSPDIIYFVGYLSDKTAYEQGHGGQ